MSASLEQMNGGEFRFYRYERPGFEPVDLLSVTSIRNLCGESHFLVNWKMANLADAALGTQKRTVIGPRGGVSDKRQVFEYPSEFAKRYAETEGQQERIDLLRRWLREQADEPRNVAATRGTLVHTAIEKNVAWDRIERPWVENEFMGLSQRDRRSVKRAVSDEDVYFVRHSVRQYWALRESAAMVILAREVRVINLTVGYAGTFDALVWLLGNFDEHGAFRAMPAEAQQAARRLRPEAVTVADIEAIGGTLVLIDWKTSKDVYTDQVLQAHAYLAAESAVMQDEAQSERVTALLARALYGGLAHIRPNRARLMMFPYSDESVRAFLGSVAFARYLARFPEPDAIFTAEVSVVSAEADNADTE